MYSNGYNLINAKYGFKEGLIFSINDGFFIYFISDE